METQEIKILIIDDDPVYRRLSGSILQDRFTVFTADRPSVAFEILRKEIINYVICDFRLPEMDGLQMLEKIKAEYSNIELIMISDAGDMDTVINAVRSGAIDYFRKPFSPAELWMSIERTQKYAALKRDFNTERSKNALLKEQVEAEIGVDIIGNSNIVADLKKQMKMVAQTPDTSILILGESGTGKELVARGIHNLSNRKNEFFGAVNMSAIPENLFESEFFGHKKGSFTGAIADKAGWFGTTNKGTLFLDEIGEMDPMLQVKLLRVLEERTFTKVGTQNPQKYDIRIIAATNKSLEEISTGNKFRLDLFHRIGTFIIYLPPLRERKNDIQDLAYHFLEILSHKMAKTIQTIHPKSLELLQNYSFPGNIRELRNIMERAIIICTGNVLLPEHFLILIYTFQPGITENVSNFNLDELEKRTIIKALAKTNNNKSEAAKLLNIEWNALYRRLQKYGIEN